MRGTQVIILCGVSAASIEIKGTVFRFMQVSDPHYHSAQETCRDVEKSIYPCTHANTTRFLRSVAAAEQPLDLVAYTGDVIDGLSGQPRQGMNDIYGVAIDKSLPWGASLGNHEDQVQHMTRSKIYEYIVNMPGDGLSAFGPIATSPGNWHVDLTADGKPVARLVFFDSRNDRRFVNISVSDAQLAWFSNLTATLPPVPTLAFYHIPMKEYLKALISGKPISGRVREVISADLPNPRMFEVLKAGGVVGGFCGHDHTNDFCAEYEGVQLCYAGSPGFGAYGSCTLGHFCYKRRLRVTELSLTSDRSALASIRTWKRLDAGGAVAGRVIDAEQLWPSTSSITAAAPGRRPVSADEIAALVSRK